MQALFLGVATLGPLGRGFALLVCAFARLLFRIALCFGCDGSFMLLAFAQSFCDAPLGLLRFEGGFALLICATACLLLGVEL